MITKHSRIVSLLALTLAGTSVGCGDPQADESYVGESLLSVKGSIEASADTKLSGDIVPAVAWFVDNAGISEDFLRALVQETEVSGEFPNGFTMNLSSPPPTAVTRSKPAKGFESEPVAEAAYIVALPRKHDPEIVIGYEDAPVEETCEENDEGEYECVSEYCDYYDHCFTEKCNESYECTIIEGQPEVKLGLGITAGFVIDYAIVYFESDAKPGSVQAWRLGADELSAGYHLVKLNHEQLSDEDYLCVDEAALQGRRDFEAAYGISGDDVDSNLELQKAIALYEDAAAMAAGCKPNLWGTVVDGDQDLVMTLGSLESE